ncbi:MAG: hypothetical protein ACR2JW_13005 [Thermomicrobiales bacterium]
MPIEPIAYEIMEKLEASGRANVRMDADGGIMWDDPTALSGVQYLRPDMFADALARLDREEQARRAAAREAPLGEAPPTRAPPGSRRRVPRVLLALFLILVAAGGIAFVYGASNRSPARTPVGPDCKLDTVCLETYVNDANAAVDTSVSSCNAALLAGNAPGATATITAVRCDTAVADRDRLVATAFGADATLRALSTP